MGHVLREIWHAFSHDCTRKEMIGMIIVSLALTWSCIIVPLVFR